MPGHTANPNGRPPKGYSITEMMREMLANEPELKKALGQAIIDKAKTGDTQAIKLLWNYMDGMPIQGVEHTGEGGGPIVIVTQVPEPDAEE